MVMLQAFVDDSASDSGDRRLFLAGYIHRAEHWAIFSDLWERELKRAPSIEYFKMSEAASLSHDGQFSGWSEAERDKKVFALARLIGALRPEAVYCSVSRNDYSQIMAPVAPYPLKNPYGMLFWEVMRMTAEHHRDVGKGRFPPVDFVFDEQGGIGDQAVMTYRWMKEDADPTIGPLLGATPIFRNDKQVVALQAADMLAWHLRREHEGRRLVGSREIAPLLMSYVLAKDVDAATLRISAAKIRRVPGVRDLQTKASWRGHRRAMQALADAGAPPPSTNPLLMHWRYLKLKAGRLFSDLRRRRRRG